MVTSIIARWAAPARRSVLVVGVAGENASASQCTSGSDGPARPDRRVGPGRGAFAAGLPNDVDAAAVGGRLLERRTRRVQRRRALTNSSAGIRSKAPAPCPPARRPQIPAAQRRRPRRRAQARCSRAGHGKAVESTSPAAAPPRLPPRRRARGSNRPRARGPNPPDPGSPRPPCRREQLPQLAARGEPALAKQHPPARRKRRHAIPDLHVPAWSSSWSSPVSRPVGCRSRRGCPPARRRPRRSGRQEWRQQLLR